MGELKGGCLAPSQLRGAGKLFKQGRWTPRGCYGHKLVLCTMKKTKVVQQPCLRPRLPQMDGVVSTERVKPQVCRPVGEASNVTPLLRLIKCRAKLPFAAQKSSQGTPLRRAASIRGASKQTPLQKAAKHSPTALTGALAGTKHAVHKTDRQALPVRDPCGSEQLAEIAVRDGRKVAREAVRKLGRSAGLHKPVGLVLSSAYILGAACHLSGTFLDAAWVPALTGGALGGLYAALNRFGMRRAWRSPRAPLNVVITGSSRGLGKAMAREFLRSGDRVIVTSRTAAEAEAAAAQLQEEAGRAAGAVAGTVCNVADPDSVARLVAFADKFLGPVDVWINNAGYSASFQGFMDATPEQLQRVVSTNLVGTLLCTRAALKAMASQTGGGHVFNMDGAGADGMPTPQYAAYGATKAGIAQLMGSVQAEAREAGLQVGVHTLSPGMVLTDLLLEGATLANKQIFNILCEQPETVAAFLVPRVRTIAARGEEGRYIKYLTITRALARFVTAPMRFNRFFNAKGERMYAEERERISGQTAKRTARLAARAAQRSQTLGVAYSLSIAASYLILVADSILAAGPH